MAEDVAGESTPDFLRVRIERLAIERLRKLLFVFDNGSLKNMQRTVHDLSKEFDSNHTFLRMAAKRPSSLGPSMSILTWSARSM